MKLRHPCVSLVCCHTGLQAWAVQDTLLDQSRKWLEVCSPPFRINSPSLTQFFYLPSGFINMYLKYIFISLCEGLGAYVHMYVHMEVSGQL